MEQSKVFGLLGAGLLMLGCFAPLVSMPVIGHVTYVQNGRGDGMIVLVLAVAAAVFALMGRRRFFLLTGSLSLCVVAYSFIAFQRKLSDVMQDVSKDLDGNPFRGIVDVAMNSIQFQWGWAPLIMGGMLLVASAFLPGGIRKYPCPHCSEPVAKDIDPCPHCGNGISWLFKRPTKKGRLAEPVQGNQELS